MISNVVQGSSNHNTYRVMQVYMYLIIDRLPLRLIKNDHLLHSTGISGRIVNS